ncbi:MAG: hypothetical protein GYA41_11545 [Bacteroidales bacterium]|nr:hypothetical protein [Bacteroidales bacterium]
MRGRCGRRARGKMGEKENERKGEWEKRRIGDDFCENLRETNMFQGC